MAKFPKHSTILKFAAVFIGVAAFTFLGIFLATRPDDQSSPSVSKDSEAIVKDDDQTASMRYRGFVTVQPSEISLFFENPSTSRKTIRLEITANINGETTTLAQVDHLSPGEKIETLQYFPSQNLEPGAVYPGKFILHFYDESGKEEIVNSTIDISVIVK